MASEYAWYNPFHDYDNTGDNDFVFQKCCW